MALPAGMRKLLKTLDVDEDTDEMSDAALYCRKRGHKWEEKSITRANYSGMLLKGQMTEQMYCGNGCGCTWQYTYNISDGDVVEVKRSYPKDYSMPRGHGRLSRQKARIAYIARRIQAAA
jgi:hypothetical protein